MSVVTMALPSPVLDDPPAGGDLVETWCLVRAAQDGDERAFAEIYDRYVRDVYRYVLTRVRDPHVAEDVTSETFLRAMRRLSSLENYGQGIRPWLFTIARNIVTDVAKSGWHRRMVITPEFDEGIRSHYGPETTVIAARERAELVRCLRQLPEDQKQCLILRFFAGLSVADTSAELGRSEGATRALQHRAVRRLAELVPSWVR